MSSGRQPESWLTVEEVSDSGTVKTAKVGGVPVSGQDVRAALSLRSAAFTVKAAMAKNGATWREILAYYYPETTLTDYT